MTHAPHPPLLYTPFDWAPVSEYQNREDCNLFGSWRHYGIQNHQFMKLGIFHVLVSTKFPMLGFSFACFVFVA